MNRNNLRPFATAPADRSPLTPREIQQLHEAARMDRAKRLNARWERFKGPLFLMLVGAGIGLELGLAIGGRS